MAACQVVAWIVPRETAVRGLDPRRPQASAFAQEDDACGRANARAQARLVARRRLLENDGTVESDVSEERLEPVRLHVTDRQL